MSQVYSMPAKATAGQTRSCDVTEGNQRHDRSTRLTMDSSILLYTMVNGLYTTDNALSNTAQHDCKWTLQYCSTRLTTDSPILFYTIDNALSNTALHD